MKRSKILAAVLLGCLLVGVIALALRVTMVGSGSLGGVLPGWSILESCTPSMPGDSRGSLGGAHFRAYAKPDSRFVQDNTVTLSHGSDEWLGRINEVSVGARADVSAVGASQFLNVDKTMPPVWFNDPDITDFLTYGSGTGQIASTYGIAIHPVDGSYFVTSWGSVDGVDRNRVIKFDEDGEFVTEFGSVGSGDGQFSASHGTDVAVTPDGTVWVTDMGNFRVQWFTTADAGLTYTYAGKLGSSGAGNGQFAGGTSSPIVGDSNSNVYIGDRGNSRIQKLNSSGVYQSQVAITGSWFSAGKPYALAIDTTDVIYATLMTSTNPLAVGTIRKFDSSLAQVGTDIVLSAPADSAGGVLNVAVDRLGNIWASWGLLSYLIRYTPSGVEDGRWYSRYTTTLTLNTNLAIEVSPSGYLAVLYKERQGYPYDTPTNGPRVQIAAVDPVNLSAAIEQYMEECDLTLNGWTLDYQGAVDPVVVFPGWSGNVWANLKDICATFGVELNYDASTQTIIVRDIGSATTTFTNIEPSTTQPVNLTGGRVVDVIYQQPRAGGGVVWDAATENVAVSIATGATALRVFATDNHPAELAQPVPTDTLPIQPGQYYVIDKDGLAVPAATWLSSGGNITLAVGSSPGTISATIQGPASNPTGFTGPFSFATGNDPDDTPALSIVGNGTFCTPKLFRRSGSQGQPFNSPFMDTKSRVLQRGHFPSLQDPNVVVRFIVPTADLPPVGMATGTVFPYESSRYRIIEVQRGNLKSTVDAERYVTAQDFDDTNPGQTPAQYDTLWAGYSASDYQIQPLRTA